MSRHATGLCAVLALASLTASAAPSSRVLTLPASTSLTASAAPSSRVLTSLSGALLAASAAPPSRVLLVTERCPEVEMARLAGLLGAELRPGGVGEVRWLRAEEEGSPTLPADEARLEVTCEAPALETAHLVARRPGAARRTERDLALADVPEPERPRMLSLALAELLREGPRHRPPLIPVDGAAPAPPDPDSLTAVAKRGGVVAGPRVRQFFGPGTRLLGVEAELAWRAVRWGASAGFGSTATGQGRIDLRVVAGHAGLALLRAEGGRLGIEVGARLEVGEVRVAGRASDARPTVSARTASRPHVAPGLFASARLRLAGPAWLQAGVASGYAWGLVASVDGNTTASTAGTWVGGSAAVRLAW